MVFLKYSKSQFRFPKFHLTLHYGDHIREFGGVKILDSGTYYYIYVTYYNINIAYKYIYVTYLYIYKL